MEFRIGIGTLLFCVILFLIVCYVIMAEYKAVFGDSEAQCTKYKSSVLVKLQTKSGGGCEWLASEYMLTKNFTLLQYNTVAMNGYGGCGCDIIILVKDRY